MVQACRRGARGLPSSKISSRRMARSKFLGRCGGTWARIAFRRAAERQEYGAENGKGAASACELPGRAAPLGKQRNGNYIFRCIFLCMGWMEATWIEPSVFMSPDSFTSWPKEASVTAS